MKCSEAKLRKSSIESVAVRLCDEALSSTSADKQVLGDVISPARVSFVVHYSLRTSVNGTVQNAGLWDYGLV